MGKGRDNLFDFDPSRAKGPRKGPDVGRDVTGDFFAHCGKSSDETGLLDMAWWARTSRGRDWPACLQRAQDKSDIAGLRLSTHRGRPLGSDSFMSKLEKLVGRRLRPLPVGRPRKTKENPKALTQGKKRRMKPKQK